LYLVYDPGFKSDKIILGNEFIQSYQTLAFNYEESKFGVKGYVTPSAPPKPKPTPTPTPPAPKPNEE
jgi:hypothetical protein